MRHASLSAYDLSFAPDLPVEFLDTAGFGFLEITIPESRSTANPEEADFLLKRLAQLLAPYEQAEHQQKPFSSQAWSQTSKLWNKAYESHRPQLDPTSRALRRATAVRGTA